MTAAQAAFGWRHRKTATVGFDFMRCSNRLLTVLGAYAFGLLPFVVNFLTNVILDTVSYYSVFHVGDLMYFTLTICWVTMSDLLVEREQHRFALWFISLVVFLVLAFIAVLFLGLSSNFIVEPPATGAYATQVHRFIGGGLILASFALVYGLAVETWINCHPRI